MNWIQESVKRSNKMKDHYKMQEIDIFIKDQLPSHIDPDLVFSTFSKLIPSHLLTGVDIIYVGQFDVFKQKQTNAVFQDGAIYVSNEQDSNQDMIDDIIHELAHSVEERFTQFIYDENDLKNEFLGKRKRLYDVLFSYNYDPSPALKTTYHYSEKIDMYFYKDVGYEAMWNLINGLFPSPYSATSLREYFAIGFEYYFMGDKTTIKEVVPYLVFKARKYRILGEIVTHISYSELKIWSECPRKHKLIYIDKLKGFVGNEYTAFGKSLHSLCENAVQDLIEEEDYDEFFELHFERELEQLTETRENLVEQMRNQAKIISPQITPALSASFGEFEVFSVEEKLYEKILNFSLDNLVFKGYIDLVIKTKDGKYHVIDWKTCSWGWDREKKNSKIITYQLTLYKKYFCQKHNIDPKMVETHFALLKRTAKKDNVEIFRVTSGPKKTSNATDLLHKALINIDRKMYIKNRLSCKGCEFYKTEHCP